MLNNINTHNYPYRIITIALFMYLTHTVAAKRHKPFASCELKNVSADTKKTQRAAPHVGLCDISICNRHPLPHPSLRHIHTLTHTCFSQALHMRIPPSHLAPFINLHAVQQASHIALPLYVSTSLFISLQLYQQYSFFTHLHRMSGTTHHCILDGFWKTASEAWSRNILSNQMRQGL